MLFWATRLYYPYVTIRTHNHTYDFIYIYISPHSLYIFLGLGDGRRSRRRRASHRHNGQGRYRNSLLEAGGDPRRGPIPAARLHERRRRPGAPHPGGGGDGVHQPPGSHRPAATARSHMVYGELRRRRDPDQEPPREAGRVRVPPADAVGDRVPTQWAAPAGPRLRHLLLRRRGVAWSLRRFPPPPLPRLAAMTRRQVSVFFCFSLHELFLFM